jgi:predicted nucleotidyltransferase
MSRGGAVKDAREFANYKQTIKNNNLIMLTEVGSKLIGLEQKDQSDRDEMGICIESPKQLLGFAPFEQDIYRSAVDRTGKVDAPSEAGDVDLVVYGLRKFVKMALTGNPNIMAMLFVMPEQCIVFSEYAVELLAMKEAFFSTRIMKAFLGYASAQRLRLNGSLGQRGVRRPELEAAHGYDVKYAMHLLRLLLQGISFGKNLDLSLSSEQLKHLQNVRKGSYTIEEINGFAQNYEASLRLRLSANTHHLPEAPDYDRIEKWLLSVYEREWRNENKTTP